MLQWLGQDPMNGIVITIAFFISLIIGRFFRESFQPNGKIIDTRIKIFMSFLLIISVTLMKHWYLPVIISFFCMIIALKLRVFYNYIKKLTFPMFLALFILVIQSSTNPEYGFLISARVFASASILILLILTTSENEGLESLRWFKVPKTILEISSFMIRYIITFSNEKEKLKLAQESRCGYSKNLRFKDKIQNIGCICGLLITQASSKSDDIYKAMLSRCWKTDLRYSMENPLHKGDMIIGAILLSGIIGLVFMDRFL